MNKHTPTVKSKPNPMTEDEAVKDTILRELSMDSRQSLAAMADKIGVSKTTVFNALNAMVNGNEIGFVPELNLDDIWRHELLHTTKWMQKREFRKLNIHEIGFGEYVCLVKFSGKKPDEEEIAAAARKSYVPQNVSMLYGEYDVFMYLVARNPAEMTFFVNSFVKSFEKYKAEVSVRPIRRTYGFFPMRNELIEELKLPEKYKKLLTILNTNARSHLSQMADDIDKNTITYLYKALLDYGIIHRSTIIHRKPGKNLTGLITYKIVDHTLFNKNRNKWLSHLVNTNNGKNASYVFMADTYEPYGGVILVNAADSSSLESFRNSLAAMKVGVEIKSQILTKSILGELGIRNFDVRYTQQYITLETDGLVPKSRIKAQEEQSRYAES